MAEEGEPDHSNQRKGGSVRGDRSDTSRLGRELQGCSCREWSPVLWWTRQGCGCFQVIVAPM